MQADLPALRVFCIGYAGHCGLRLLCIHVPSVRNAAIGASRMRRPAGLCGACIQFTMISSYKPFAGTGCHTMRLRAAIARRIAYGQFARFGAGAVARDLARIPKLYKGLCPLYHSRCNTSLGALPETPQGASPLEPFLLLRRMASVYVRKSVSSSATTFSHACPSPKGFSACGQTGVRVSLRVISAASGAASTLHCPTMVSGHTA